MFLRPGKSFKKVSILITLPLLIILSIIILPQTHAASTPTHLSTQSTFFKSTEPQSLERFVGEWEGQGRSHNHDVQDLMRFQWVLNQRFLSFSYQALAGDNYEGEGYVWYNPDRSVYEWWEFNNGIWPVREHQGQYNDNQLILEEHTEDRDMRLTFTFVDSDTLDMTEGFINGEQVDTYVVIRFYRKIEGKR